MPKRRRLATGIYADPFGISVVYSLHGKPVETRFPRGMSLDRLQRWRARQIDQRPTAPQPPRQTLTRDVVRVLKRLKGRPSYESERSHLKAWLPILGRLQRHTVTRDQIALTLAEWTQEGYAARTIRHRCRALRALYLTLDGPDTQTPLDQIPLPKKPKGRPVWVSDETIAAVALQLRRQEMDGIGRLRDRKTRARFLVLATTGRRPIEVQRARREDVDLDRRLWFVRTAKGGVNSVLALNDEQLAAWRLFVQAQAWGAYDERSFVRTLQRNGWPKGIRPYTVRHAAAFTIRRRGGDAADVQDQLGHASIMTAREFYFTTDPVRQAAISAVLDGRFPVAVFADSHDDRSHDGPRTDAKERGIIEGLRGTVARPAVGCRKG